VACTPPGIRGTRTHGGRRRPGLRPSEVRRFAVPAIAWRRGLNPVAAFWFAYIVTRPLGASFADYVSKPHAISGLNFRDLPTTGLPH
jgi:hypothetical protein